MKYFNVILGLLFLLLSVSAHSQNAEALNNDEQKQLLWRHNFWRKQANTKIDKLKWSNTLAMAAIIRARTIAEDCNTAHVDGRFGENIHESASRTSVQAVVNSWADGRKFYDADEDLCDNNSICKAYRQMIWAKTTMVGCATVRCKSGTYIMVCVYNPKGNIEGESPF